jgi:hypothetical protein
LLLRAAKATDEQKRAFAEGAWHRRRRRGGLKNPAPLAQAGGGRRKAR